MSCLSDDCKFLDRPMPEDMKVMFRARFFYPNMCYVCNITESEVQKLKRCPNCNMISYCGKVHQDEHWPDHKDVCREVNNLLKSSGSNNLFDSLRTMVDPDKRLQKKQNLMAVIQKRLKRNFDDFEKQMFQHPRVCVVCLESDPLVLQNCQFCPQVSFCENHKNPPEHHEWCSYYKICLLLDWKSIFSTRFEICPVIQKVPFFSHLEDTKIPGTMEKYLAEYMEETKPMLITLYGAKMWPYLCSELYTNSLTLMHVLNKLEIKIESNLLVHVIGAQNPGEKDFSDLEMLLHLLPQLMTLNVVVVGKELDQTDKETRHKIEVCEICTTANKNLVVEMIKLPYGSYVESKSFEKPHFVITYNFGGCKVRMWTESILKMMKIQAPFVMTTNTKLRAKMEHQKMTDLFGHLARKSFFEKNPFASNRPQRDAAEDGLQFSNNYIAVYTLYEQEKEKQSKRKKRRGQSEIELPDFVKEEERELRRQKSLMKKKESGRRSSESTDEAEKTDDSQNLLNLVENIGKSIEANSDKKSTGEGKAKKKKKNKNKKQAASQTSGFSRENNSFEKEEKSKNAKEGNVPKAVNSSKEENDSSQSSATDMSNQSSGSSRDNSLFEKEEKSGDAKKEDIPEDLNSSKEEVDSSQKNTKETSEELLDLEVLNLSTQNQEALLTPKESEKKNQDDLMDKEKPGAEVPSPDEETEEARENLYTKEQRSDSTNQKEEAEPSAKENAEKSEKSSTEKESSSVENSERNEQTQVPVKPKSPKSKKRNSDKRIEESSKENKEFGNQGKLKKIKSKDQSSEKLQENFMKKENNEEDKENDNEGKSMKKKSNSSKQDRASENKEQPKNQPASVKKFQPTNSSDSTTEAKEHFQEDSLEKEKNKAGENQGKSKKKKSNSSKQNELSENQEKSEDKPAGAEKSEISKPAVFKKTENKCPELNEEGTKSGKKKNKKPKNQELAEPENQDEPPNLQNVHGLATIVNKTEDLRQENENLGAYIQRLTVKFTGLKKNGKDMARNLLKEMGVLKKSLECLEDRVRAVASLDDE